MSALDDAAERPQLTDEDQKVFDLHFKAWQREEIKTLQQMMELIAIHFLRQGMKRGTAYERERARVWKRHKPARRASTRF